MNLKDGLVLYWKLDGDSRDSLDINDGVDTNVTYTSGKLNQCGSFDGVSSYISSSGNGLPTGGQSRTYAAWVYPNSYASPDGIIIYAGDSSTPPNQSFCLYQSDFSGVYYIFSDAVNVTNNLTVPIYDLAPLNEWSLICFTLENDNYVYYLNGIERLSGTFAVPINTYTSSFVVGNRQDSFPGFWDGLIDEVSVWNRALSPQEVYRLYNNGVGRQYPFQKVIMPNTSLGKDLVGYWKLDGNSNDSLNLNNGVDTGVTWTNGKISRSARFNGSAKIEISNAAASPFRQNEEITYSLWVNMVAGSQIVLGTATASGQGSGGINIAPGYSYFTWTPTVPANDRAWYAVTTIPDNTWTHIAFTILFSGASVGNFYVNGSPISTTLDLSAPTDGTPNTAYNVTNGDCIGARYVNGFIPTFGGGYSTGDIDEVGLWSRVLSSSEINILYNSGRGFSFPFRRVLSQNNTTLVNGLIGYLNLNGNANDSIGNFSSTDNSPSYKVGKIGLGRNFNGVVGDDITMTQTLVNYTKFSISIWFNADDLSGYKCVIGSSPFDVFLGGTQIQILWNSGGVVNKFWNFSHGVNEWHNLIIVFDGTLANDDRIKVYGDGVLTTATTFPTIPSNFDIQTIYLALSVYGYYYDGVLDEFGVWSRVLTDEEIAYLYNSGYGKTYPFLTNILKH